MNLDQTINKLGLYSCQEHGTNLHLDCVCCDTMRDIWYASEFLKRFKAFAVEVRSSTAGCDCRGSGEDGCLICEADDLLTGEPL